MEFSSQVLNLGCGKDIKPTVSGWVNVDAVPGPGVDVVFDLEREGLWPWDADSVDGFLMSHLIEHLENPLSVMEEAYRVAKPGAVMVVKCPHGASDDAWEDQTHLRPYFPGSFLYFGQPMYHKADYGYRGDWNVKQVILWTEPQVYDACSPEELTALVRQSRNIVREMTVELEAIKPARQPGEPVELKIVLRKAGPE